MTIKMVEDPDHSHLLVLRGWVLYDLHSGGQRGVGLLVLLLLTATLHPGGGLGEEVTVLTEDSLRDRITFVSLHISSTLLLQSQL